IERDWYHIRHHDLPADGRCPHCGTQMPYLGLGYSGQLVQTGWGFWADVGLVVQSPGSALGLGRVVSGSQGVDDLIRELRLSPMLQLGVSYSF
ncbi:MAG: hypothetical protein J0L57_01765, partial [Burkholderiales bacterium]|nr:hypothetical protein [Burkholderiales bacterium]